MRITSFAWLTFLLLLAVTAHGQHTDSVASYVIIVHPSNTMGSATRAFLAEAFLKKATRWPNGETIRPVDLDRGSSVRQRFTRDVLGRSPEAVRSYWQRVIFSGRGVPPIELDDDRAVVHYVATHRGAVGYVSVGTELRGVEALVVR